MVLWVYLFFCAKKTESFGRNTQTRVASGRTTGKFGCLREAMVKEGCRVLRYVRWASGSAQGVSHSGGGVL